MAGDKPKDQDEEREVDLDKHALPVHKRLKLPISQFGLRRQLQFRLSNGLLRLQDNLEKSTQYEMETGTAFNLLPVFMGIGVGIYFSAPAEPSLIAVLLSLVGFWFVFWKMQLHGKTYYLVAIITAIMAGMFSAKLSTLTNPTAIIERQLTGEITGTVIFVDQNRRGSPRYIVQPNSLSDLEKVQIPHRVRLSAASKHSVFLPGDVISGIVRLQPVSGPVYPGGYDFSFFSWFEGMGGSGFFMGAPMKIDADRFLDWKSKFEVLVNQFRIGIEKRISASLPGVTGGVAIALVTGNKSGIPEDVQQSLRNTGLAHILAISGLHMALVTLTVIWLIRFLAAQVPYCVLHYPVKKYAVCAGFFSATFYLFISGGGIATQRAWVMISVMLLALLMDRRAITMRSVSISALIILILNPQSLLAPGFQMSFAAVASLVAGYEVLNKRRRLRAENTIIPVRNHWFFRVIKLTGTYFGGIAITSLIAGTATSFIAAWHFHQVAPLGLVANLMAMPFVAIVVMPFVLASMLLMPYGLEFLALKPVSFGIEKVIEVSKVVESYSPSGNTGLLPGGAILAFAMFLVTLTIFKTRLRYLAFIPILAFMLFWQKPEVPDILIAENGRAVAVKNESGELGLLYKRASKFVTGIWGKSWSGGKFADLKLSKDQCNRERCIYVLPNSKTLHILYNPDLIGSSCQRADVLIAPRLWWINCKARVPELILKRYDFEQYGAHAIYSDADMMSDSNSQKSHNFRIETALSKQARPWQRHVSVKE